MMKLGIKLWSKNIHLFNDAIQLQKTGVFDFLELYVVPQTFDEEKFEVLKQIPITIHATHELHGLNLSQENPQNTTMLKEVFRFADFFDTKTIVLHPGSGGTLSTTLEALKKIRDRRIYIENMPYRVMPVLGTDVCSGARIEEVQEMIDLGFGFCLDFGHAVAASVAFQLSYKEYIEQFFRLKPTYFHLSDGHGTLDYDEHMDLGKGKIDYSWIKNQIAKLPHSRVVFETPKKGDTLENDVRNIEYFKKL